MTRTMRDPVRPILKWAGGKRQMLDRLIPLAPDRYGTYIEPFVGGGALFFALRPTHAIISDSNPELINMYVQVRDRVGEVIRLLNKFHNTRDEFLEIRALDWTVLDPALAAARMIYLNRTCFNGLYRVNRQGRFNVAFAGYKHPTICDEPALAAASQALQEATIVCDDYANILDRHAKPGDFVFLDPPYVPSGKTADFTGYTKDRFGQADQQALARLFTRLDHAGCRLLLTNSNTPLAQRLYAGYGQSVVPVKRSISRNPATRRGEDLIVNNMIGKETVR